MAILADQDKGKSKGAAPGTTKKKKAEPGKGEEIATAKTKSTVSSALKTKTK